MSSSTASSGTGQMSGVSLLNESQIFFGEALSNFKINHDMCVASGFFSQTMISKMDACALGYREFESETTKVTLASQNWTDEIINLFQKTPSQSGHDFPVNKLKTLGGQAQKLGCVYNVLSAWSRNIAGGLHQAYLDTNQEAPRFVELYQEKERDAQVLVNIPKEILKKARVEYEGAQNKEQKLALLQLGLSWNLIALAVLSGQLTDAQREVSSPLSTAALNEQHMAEILDKFKAEKSNEKQMEMISESASKLVVTLRALETAFEAISIFWTRESSVYIGQGSSMQVASDDSLREHDRQMWLDAKSEFENYNRTLSIALYAFQVQTNAEPLCTKDFRVDLLDLTLRVPCDLNAEEIMDQ